MKIVLASDHAGYSLKEEIKKHLSQYEVIDCGTSSPSVSVDYPVYAKKAAELVASKEADFGILCCGTGEGIMMAANKVKGIRCGVGYDLEVTKLLRMHNNANMVSFGARFMNVNDVLNRVDAFLSTPFEGGRHQKRIDEVTEIEKENH